MEISCYVKNHLRQGYRCNMGKINDVMTFVRVLPPRKQNRHKDIKIHLKFIILAIRISSSHQS